jgi:hypothetical protein
MTPEQPQQHDQNSSQTSTPKPTRKPQPARTAKEDAKIKPEEPTKQHGKTQNSTRGSRPPREESAINTTGLTNCLCCLRTVLVVLVLGLRGFFTSSSRFAVDVVFSSCCRCCIVVGTVQGFLLMLVLSLSSSSFLFFSLVFLLFLGDFHSRFSQSLFSWILTILTLGNF